MTICIAAICEATDRPKIIFCADRMVTGQTQFEHGVSKIKALTDYCGIMESGDALQSDIVIKNAKKILKDKNELSIKEIAEIISDEYEKVLNTNINKDILHRVGLDMSTFPDKTKNMPGGILANLISQIQNYGYDFELEYLVFGIDKEKEHFEAHLYKIGRNGKIESFDNIGFATIGSGSNLSEAEMTKYVYSPTLIPISATIYRVFGAKKVAERVQGVGAHTDFGIMYITKEKKITIWEGYWNPDFMRTLEESFKMLQEQETTLLVKITQDIEKTLYKKEEQS